jgi:O-acetylserine/cysteine efflux transporter
MAAAAALLGEAMPAWKLAATALVVGGLALNAVASRGGRMGRS